MLRAVRSGAQVLDALEELADAQARGVQHAWPCGCVVKGGGGVSA